MPVLFMGIKGLKATGTHPHMDTLYIDAHVKRHIKSTLVHFDSMVTHCSLHVGISQQGKVKKHKKNKVSVRSPFPTVSGQSPALINKEINVAFRFN